MSKKTESGFLIIADISGYTSYVARTELEHSQEVLAELLGLIVDHFQPVINVLRLEGDAVFANVPETQIPRGETLVEILETCYTAFRDHIRGIIQLTTCKCKACKAIPSLDLKFIVHYGEYIVQSVSGISELVGSEVNRLFRLTKNQVKAASGWDAYILYTQASAEKLGLETGEMLELVETYEHLGDVTTYTVDLHQRFEEISSARYIVVETDEAHVTVTYDFDGPPAVVWQWLNDPYRRNEYTEGISWSAETRIGGRTGKGATNHCAHGKNGLACETILDWRPFQYVTTLTTNNTYPYKLMDMQMTYLYEAIDDGRRTRVEWRGRIERIPGFLAKMMAKGFAKNTVANLFEPANRKIIEIMGQEAPESGQGLALSDSTMATEVS